MEELDEWELESGLIEEGKGKRSKTHIVWASRLFGSLQCCIDTPYAYDIF